MALAAVVGAWYAPMLLFGTVQFDGVDVHYAAQRYLSDELHAGRIPFWTPYIFSGFPFLADLQTAAWYPLNWPFYVAGIVPASLGLELLVHGLVAASGTYVLAYSLTRARVASVGAAVFYALSAYFATHSQHVGMSEAAAWLPWLVVYLRAPLTRTRVALGALLGAALALPGSFQVALYAVSFAGLAVLVEQRSWHVLLRLAIVAVGGALVAAVMILPALELVANSVRSELDPRSVNVGYFRPDALVTLVWPDFYGLLSGTYHGPGDSTQHDFYAGILLLPLAALGVRNTRVLRLAALLALPFLWYALGPIGGLFRVLVRLPGFANVELPMHGWFLPALGLALLGGAGLARVPPRLATIAVTLTLVDVLVFNQLRNPLAFARQSFDTLYGAPLRAFAAQADPDKRVYGAPLSAVGYRNHALQSRIETTYGYNPLELRGYAAYADAAESDPALVSGFAAAQGLQPDGTLAPLADALPLATFVDDPSATANVMTRGLDHLTIGYTARNPSLLRVAIADFPGWRATLNNTQLPLEAVDGAFIGVRVPPGDGQIELRYTPRFFGAGAAISGLALATCGLVLASNPRRRKVGHY